MLSRYRSVRGGRPEWRRNGKSHHSAPYPGLFDRSGNMGGRRGLIATGPNDRPGREHRLHLDGYGHQHRC